MKLKELLEDLEFTSPEPVGEIEIKQVACHSKLVREGALFVAVKGRKVDGFDFIAEAISRGAKCIISERDFHATQQVKKVLVSDARVALARISSNFYGRPAEKLRLLGITGTNGKTTISLLLEKILKHAGFAVGVIGTINHKLGERVIPASCTTPDPLELQYFLNEMAANSLNYAVMEVSSHSIDQRRVEGLQFELAIFTNLTQDHLDYHQGIEGYFNTKAKLFEALSPDQKAVINVDDAYGRRIIPRTKASLRTYGIDTEATVSASNLKLEMDAGSFLVRTPSLEFELKTSLIGRHNVYNILAATAACIAQGIDVEVVKSAIESIERIPGRLEPVHIQKEFKVFVDYAHTEDALRNVLTTLREVARGRIILVFGCGGDRDRLKRPLMGKAAGELSDFVVLTTDNPRSEDPERVVAEIEAGMKGGEYMVELDRRRAIKKALSLSRPDDIVLIAGKGHEAYQVFKDVTVPFDDREVVKELCWRM